MIEEKAINLVNGILIESIPEDTDRKFSQKVICPCCKSLMTVFKSALKTLKMVDYEEGYIVGEGFKCPICDSWLDTDGKLVPYVVLGGDLNGC